VCERPGYGRGVTAKQPGIEPASSTCRSLVHCRIGVAEIAGLDIAGADKNGVNFVN